MSIRGWANQPLMLLIAFTHFLTERVVFLSPLRKNMKSQSQDTVLALANAIELVTGTVHELLGDQIAATINGQQATRAALANLVASRIQSRFSNLTISAVK